MKFETRSEENKPQDGFAYPLKMQVENDGKTGGNSFGTSWGAAAYTSLKLRTSHEDDTPVLRGFKSTWKNSQREFAWDAFAFVFNPTPDAEGNIKEPGSTWGKAEWEQYISLLDGIIVRIMKTSRESHQARGGSSRMKVEIAHNYLPLDFDRDVSIPQGGFKALDKYLTDQSVATVLGKDVERTSFSGLYAELVVCNEQDMFFSRHANGQYSLLPRTEFGFPPDTVVPTSNSTTRVTTANNVAPAVLANNGADGAAAAASASRGSEDASAEEQRLRKEVADLVSLGEGSSEECNSRVERIRQLNPTYYPPNQVRSSQD